MAGVSGNQGSVQAGSSHISELTKWQATAVQGMDSYVGAGSAPWPTTVRTNKGVKGTLTGKYDPLNPPEAILYTDTAVTLILKTSSTKVWGTGTAILGDIEHITDINTGAVQEWTCPFTSTGGWDINV